MHKVAPGWFLLSYIWAVIINRVPVFNISVGALFFFLLILPPDYVINPLLILKRNLTLYKLCFLKLTDGSQINW